MHFDWHAPGQDLSVAVRNNKRFQFRAAPCLPHRVSLSPLWPPIGTSPSADGRGHRAQPMQVRLPASRTFCRLPAARHAKEDLQIVAVVVEAEIGTHVELQVLIR